MAAAMRRLLFASIALCLAFVFLYQYRSESWIFACAITWGTVAYHLLIRYLAPVILYLVKRKKYCYESFWFRQKAWEPGLYEKLGVKKWKKKVELWTYDPSEFSTEHHTLEEIINNMCHAEAVHELIVFAGFSSLLFAVPFGEFWVFFLTAVLAGGFDMIFVILQRYNRPRVLAILKRKKTKGFC